MPILPNFEFKPKSVRQLTEQRLVHHAAALRAKLALHESELPRLAENDREPMRLFIERLRAAANLLESPLSKNPGGQEKV
jgi:hypothetical protein